MKKAALLALVCFGMTAVCAASTQAFQSPQDYCQAVEVPVYKWNVPVFDGPAELPNRCVATNTWNTPAPGPVVIVSRDQDLQAAYNAAACGTTLRLKHGATWTGPFNFAPKGCDAAHWIIVESDGTVPAVGNRVDPSDEPQLATISIGKANGFTFFGDYQRFIGIEFAKVPGSGLVYGFANMGGSNHVIFDRVYMHGNPGEETQHGVQINTGKYIAVINSYFADFHCIAVTGSCGDAQAISGGTGAAGDLISQSGPIVIENNFLEASTENLMFGGGIA